MTYSGQFSLSISENKALGETIDAVSRIVDEAIIQLDGGLEIVVVDTANVASVEAVVPSGAFDTYSGDEGRFGVNIDALDNALSNINKSEAVEIEVDGDSREITVSSGDESAVLDLIDTEDMRDPPDLQDGRKGDGGLKTLDYSGQVTVTDSEFNRVVRVSDEISDHIALGITDDDAGMAFKTFAEGDTDDVMGYPPARFDRTPEQAVGGLFSLEYVDAVRLATPKRKTDLEIAFAERDFPVRFSYTTGGAVPGEITIWIAPRISSEGGDTLEQLRKHNRGESLLPSPDFEAKLDGGRAKEMFGLFGTFVDEYRLSVTDEGMETRAVDPANVAMRIINVEPGHFDLYVPSDGFPERQIGVPGNRVEGVLKKWTKTQPLTFQYDSDVRKMGFLHPIFSVSMGSIDPDSIRAEPDIPEVDMTAEVEVQPATYVGEMSQSLAGNESVVHVASNNSLYVLGSDDGDIQDTNKIPTQKVRGVGLGKYSSDYIDQFLDTMPADSPTPLELRLATEFPMGYEVNVDGGSLTEMVTIAPRVVEDVGQLASDVESALDGAVDLSWVTDSDEKDRLAVDSSLFKGIETKSVTERKREERLSTFPIESTVETNLSGTGVKVIDAADMAVEENTITEVIEAAEARIEDADVGNSEKVADVTFTSATDYTLDFVALQPDTARRFNTEDGVRFRDITRESGNYLYYSNRDQTPARYQLSLRAVNDGDTIGFKLGYKPPRGTEVTESFVDSGFDSMLEAYDAMIEYANTTTSEEMVREAGVEVEMTNKEVGEMLDEITDKYVDYSVLTKPINDERDTYAAVRAGMPFLPDAGWENQILAERPDDVSGPYEVRYVLSFSPDGVKYGDGARISGDELAARTVGFADSRAEIEPLMQDAFDEVASFGSWYARTSRQQDTPMQSLPSPREGNTEKNTKFTQAFLPGSIETISEEVADRGYPVNFEDVSGIGPARAEELEELGLQDMIDLTSVMASVKSAFWVGQTLTEFPDDPKDNIREAAGNIWANIIWPKRSIPGDYPDDAEDATPTPDAEETVETTPEADRILDMFAEEVVKEMEVEEVEEFAELPDGYNENQWDVAVVANPDGGFGERLIVRPLDPDVRRKPDLEITDEVIDKLTKKDLAPWQYEEGDVIALAGLLDKVRSGVGVSAFTPEPGHDLLLERTTDDDGNLDVEAGEWVGVHPEQLLDNASVGDLQAGWQTAPINDTNPNTFNVGFDGGRHYHYRELRSPPYFVFKWNTNTENPEPLDENDPPTVNYAALNVTPPGDEVIGLDQETEREQGPTEPVYASEYEDEYDLDPFLQSADDVKQLVDKNRDILIRVGGFIKETEPAGMMMDAAGFRVPDRVAPEGVYTIPASSKKSTVKLVGIKRVSDLPAVISTNRPLTMQARDTLEEYGIEEEITAKEIENPPLGVGEDTVVGLRLREAPPVETTERLEVQFKEPVEVWESDRNGKIFIYRDRVVSEEQGQMPTDPETAARESRAQERFQPVDVPDDSPFAGLEPEGEPPEDGEDDRDEDTFEVEVGVDQGIAQRVKADLDPRIKTGEDPNDVAGAILDRMNDDLTMKELVRFIGRSGNTDSEVAIATVRGGEIEETRFGSEVLVQPKELVGFEWVVDFPSVDQEPTAGEINEAYPGLNRPQAKTLTEYVRSVDDLLNFTPAGLRSISGIGDATINKLTDEPAATVESKTLRELRDGDTDDDAEDDEPDDSGVSMTDILNDRRIGEWATIEGDVGGDEVVLLALDDTRTVGIHLNKVDIPDQDILESFGVLFDEPVETGLTAGGIPDPDAESVVAKTRLGDVTFRAELIEDHLESNPPADVREMLEPDDDTDDTTDATDRFREAVSEARDVLDDAEELVAEGELRREGRISNLAQALDQLSEFDVDPDTLDTDIAMNAIDEVETLTDQVRELVENPDRQGERGTQRDMVPDDRLEEQLEDDEPGEEPDDEADDEPGEEGEEPEFTRGRIKELIQTATTGVEVSPKMPGGGDLQRIVLKKDPTASVSLDREKITVGVTDTTRSGIIDAIERAVEAWDDAVDVSTVNVAEIERNREAVNSGGVVSVPEELPEPDVEPGELPDDVQSLIDETVDALSSMAVPVDSLPATFSMDGGVIQARPDVNDEWDDILTDEPPLLRQDGTESEEAFFVRYVKALTELMTQQMRERVNIPSLEDALGVDMAEEVEQEQQTQQQEPDDERIRPDLGDPFRSMIDTAMVQNIPKEDREMDMAEALEESDEYDAVRDVFPQVMIGLVFPRGGASGGRDFAENVKVEISAPLDSGDGDRLAVPQGYPILKTQEPLIRVGEAFQDFVDLIDMVDPQSDRFADLTSKFQSILDVTEFRIENDMVNWNDAILDLEEVQKVVTRSGDLWRNGYLTQMDSVSAAWVAAQRIHVLSQKQEDRQLRKMIEDEIGTEPARGTVSWYLKQAYQIYLQNDTFDAEAFIENFHDVFRPGEGRQEAERRRGDVDLDQLRENVAAGVSPGMEPDMEMDVDTEPETEPEPEPEPEPETEPSGEEKSVADLKSDIRDRM